MLVCSLALGGQSVNRSVSRRRRCLCFGRGGGVVLVPRPFAMDGCVPAILLCRPSTRAGDLRLGARRSAAGVRSLVIVFTSGSRLNTYLILPHTSPPPRSGTNMWTNSSILSFFVGVVDVEGPGPHFPVCTSLGDRADGRKSFLAPLPPSLFLPESLPWPVLPPSLSH